MIYFSSLAEDDNNKKNVKRERVIKYHARRVGNQSKLEGREDCFTKDPLIMNLSKDVPLITTFALCNIVKNFMDVNSCGEIFL